MKKAIWMTAAVTGMLLGTPHTDAQAEVNVNINTRNRPTFVIDSRPDFVIIPGRGFSVSIGSPYDIIRYGSLYYVYQDGYWYRSSHYRGPWIAVRERHLPYKIRRHRIEDIRRYRDYEYRRHDRRNNWEHRNNDNRNNHNNDNRYDNDRGRRN